MEIEEEWTGEAELNPCKYPRGQNFQVMENEQPQPCSPWEADYRVKIKRGGI